MTEVDAWLLAGLLLALGASFGNWRAWSWLGAKAVGALLGGILALAFLPPKNMRDFITRSVFSLIAGFVFADPVRLWLKWEADMSMHIAAGALTALCSWWVFGSILKVIAAWKPK